MASRYTDSGALDAIFNKDYRLSGGELSDEKGYKVYGYVGD